MPVACGAQKGKRHSSPPGGVRLAVQGVRGVWPEGASADRRAVRRAGRRRARGRERAAGRGGGMSGAAQEAGTLPLVGYPAQDPAEVGGLIRRHLPPNWAFATFSAGKRPEDLQEVSYLVVAGSRLTEADIEAARKLRLVHKVGVGYDEIDIAALDARDIPLAVCPLGSAEAVAEHAVSLALAALKSIPYLDRSVREARRWPKWESRHRIRRLRGRVVGIVGRSEEHTSELQSLMRNSYAGFGL